MSDSTKLTDKQRIKMLENEILSMRKIFMIQIDRIEKIVGITPDYIHKEVKPLDLE